MRRHSVSGMLVAVACCTAALLLPMRADAAEGANTATVMVVDKEGNALADVYVIDCETQEEYATDAAGRFACKVSDEAQYFYAVDRRHQLALIAPLPAGARQLTMELKPAQLISGRVTDPNGRPAAGVQVASMPISSVCVLTNEQGQFAVGLLPTRAPRGMCLMARDVERNLAALVDISRQAARVDLQLAPALSLSGTVTAEDGTPLSGATASVWLRRWNWGHSMPVKRAITDEGGRFTFPALPQLQEYELHVRADGYVTKELATGVISVVKDRAMVGPVVLVKATPAEASKEMGRLRLRLVDVDLKPVDAVSAQIWKQEPGIGPDPETVPLVSSRTPGLYETDLFPTGKYYALSIDVAGYARFWLSDVEVHKEPQDAIVCKLSRGGTIAGVVTDDQGKPLAGLPVVINAIPCKRELTTDPNGRFVAEHLPDLHYSVVVEPEAESPYATAVLLGGASYDARDIRMVVNRKTEVKTATSLIGTSIWRLGRATLPLDPSSCQGKAILLCLFDVNQRPSRNCLRQLAAKAKEFEAQGVIVAAAHVATADRAGFEKWAGENGVAFAVGAVRDPENSFLAAARTGSLPWLILTDGDHIVRAEGFQLGELNGILARTKEMQK